MVNKDEDYYDSNYREKMILQFKMEVPESWLGLGIWVEKEMKEDEKRMVIYEAKKCNKVVDVATDDESFPAGEQLDLSLSLRLPEGPEPKPSVWSSPSISYEAPVPIRWVPHPTMKRTVPSDNTTNQDRTKKCRKMMIMKTEEEHNQHKKNKEVKKREKKNSLSPPPLPQEIPTDLREAVNKFGGTTPMWLTEKNLTISDTNPQQGRVFLLNCGALEEFLTAEEKIVINNKGEKGLKVIVVDTSGEEYDLDLRIWGSLNQFVLTRKWNLMVKKLRLEPIKDTVQLWMFRLPAEKDLKICFAINVKRTPKA